MQTNNTQYINFADVAADFFPDSEFKNLEKNTLEPFLNIFRKQSLKYERATCFYEENFLDIALIYRCISENIVDYIFNKYNLDYRKFDKITALSYKKEILKNFGLFLLPDELYTKLLQQLNTTQKIKNDNSEVAKSFQEIISNLAESIVLNNEEKHIKQGFVSMKLLLKFRLQEFANIHYFLEYVNSLNYSDFNFKICELLHIVNYENFPNRQQISLFIKYITCKYSFEKDITRIEDIFEIFLLLNNLSQIKADIQKFNSVYIKSEHSAPIENYSVYEFLNAFKNKSIDIPKKIFIFNTNSRYHPNHILFSLVATMENYPLKNFYIVIDKNVFESNNFKYDLIINNSNEVSRNFPAVREESFIEDVENINFISAHLNKAGKAIFSIRIQINNITKKYKSELFDSKNKLKLLCKLLNKNCIESIIESYVDFEENPRKFTYTILMDKNRDKQAKAKNKITFIKRKLASRIRRSDLTLQYDNELEATIKEYISIFDCYNDDSIVCSQQNKVLQLKKICFNQLKNKNFSYFFKDYNG